jgi:hypothetical protein
MIMMNYADLWIVHTQVASQLKGTKLELKVLKARSMLLGACLECLKLKLELDTHSLKVKELETKLLGKLRVSATSPPCEVCGNLKGKLFHDTKENTKLRQEVAYLTSHLKRTVVSEKMIEDDLNYVEESTTKSIYKLGVGYERYENKGEKSALKFVPSSNYHKEVRIVLPSLFLALTTTKRRKHSNPPKLTTHPIQSHVSNPREK